MPPNVPAKSRRRRQFRVGVGHILKKNCTHSAAAVALKSPAHIKHMVFAQKLHKISKTGKPRGSATHRVHDLSQKPMVLNKKLTKNEKSSWGLKLPSKASRWLQVGLKLAQNLPQVGFKLPSRASSWPQDGPKLASSWLQVGSQYMTIYDPNM